MFESYNIHNHWASRFCFNIWGWYWSCCNLFPYNVPMLVCVLPFRASESKPILLPADHPSNIWRWLSYRHPLSTSVITSVAFSYKAPWKHRRERRLSGGGLRDINWMNSIWLQVEKHFYKWRQKEGYSRWSEQIKQSLYLKKWRWDPKHVPSSAEGSEEEQRDHVH